MAVFWPSWWESIFFILRPLARSSFDTILLAVLVRTISPISCARTLLQYDTYDEVRAHTLCHHVRVRYDKVVTKCERDIGDIDQSISRSHFVPCDILRSRHRTSCALALSAVAICSALALRAWPWRLSMSHSIASQHTNLIEQLDNQQRYQLR